MTTSNLNAAQEPILMRRSIGPCTGIIPRHGKECYLRLLRVSGRLLFLAAVSLITTSAWGVTPQDLLAHPPTKYFNDYADIIQPASAAYLNETLAKFERDTSNQVLVVVVPEWPADLVFDDYAQNLFRAAKIGQQGKGNGLLVLVSVKEHKVRIHTGRGLEGALPDALCIRIIREEFTPQFQTGNYDQGFRQGLAAVMAAARGEYGGDGKTAAQKSAGSRGINGWAALAVFIVLLFFPIGIVFMAFRYAHMHRVRGSTGARSGRRDASGSSDAGSSSGDDSGFSGGGGDSGGGGASGAW